MAFIYGYDWDEIIAGYEPPAKPDIPDAINGVLDLSGKKDVTVNIPVYRDYTPCDKITLMFGDVRIPVPGPSQVRQPGSVIGVSIEASQLQNGEAIVRYVAVDAADNEAESLEVTIDVKNAPFVRFPRPIFPDYPRQLAARQKILNSGGVRVRVMTAQLQAGDHIKLVWEGYFVTGDIAPGASAVLLNREVNTDDKDRGSIEVWASMSIVLAVGRDGLGSASYSILRGPTGSQSPAGVSSAARLLIEDEDVFLLVAATSGASTQNRADLAFLEPMNRLWLGAQPFTDVSVLIDNGAMFNTPTPASVAHVRTDVRGLAFIDFYVTGGDQSVTCTITAEIAAGVDITSLATIATATSTFAKYKVTGDLISFCSRDFAVADGADLCMVCAAMPANYPTLTVNVDGDALVCGWSDDYTSFVHNDYTCTFNIVCTTVSTVGVRLGGKDADISFNVNFKASPFSSI